MITSVLGGGDGLQGLDVELRLTTTDGVNDGSEGRAAKESRVFRAVPLLRVVGRGPERVLVVGQARVLVATSGVVVELALQAAWGESAQWGPLDAAEIPLELLEPALRSPGHSVGRVVRSEPGRQLVAARLAKGLAEGLRGSGGRTGLLAQIVEIALAVNRARDQAREAAREGMWLWFTDDKPATASAPAWRPCSARRPGCSTTCSAARRPSRRPARPTRRRSSTRCSTSPVSPPCCSRSTASKD